MSSPSEEPVATSYRENEDNLAKPETAANNLCATEVNIVINVDPSGKAVSYNVIRPQQELANGLERLPTIGASIMSCCSCNFEHQLVIYSSLGSMSYIPQTNIKPEPVYELQLGSPEFKEEPWDDGAFESELVEDVGDVNETQPPPKKRKFAKRGEKKPKKEDGEAQCNICLSNFSSFSALKRHRKSCSNDSKTYACKDCNKEFPRLLQLRSHERFCSKEKRGEPTCNICQKKFSTWYSALQHMDHIHYKIKPYICHECGKQFRSQKEVDEHLLHHQDPKPYECDLCQKRFPSRISIRHHIMLNHMESVVGVVWCYECNPPKKLINQKRLEMHQTKHRTGKTYPCPQCSRTFKNESNIKAHIYRFHVPMELKQKFVCEADGCTFVTTVKAQFENHRYVHMDDSQKPFHCDYCGKGFINKNLKVRHERIHTGERPFHCDVCGKTFRSHDDLKVHMRLHTGEKPYQCEICQQRFSDRGCYRSHILVHEKQMNIVISKSVRKFDKSYTVPLMLD